MICGTWCHNVDEEAEHEIYNPSASNSLKELLAENDELKQELCSAELAHGVGVAPDFLNQFVDLLWPHVSKYVVNLLLTVVQPLVQDALPKIMKDSFSFDEKRCSLGKKALHFKSVHTSQVVQDTVDGKCEGINMTADLELDGDTEIFLKIAGSELGVEGLLVRGKFIIELVQLTDDVPFFQGIRFFFLNPPDIALRWGGAVELLNKVGWVKHIIIDLITQAVSESLVLPHRIGTVLDPKADVFRITAPRPEGILTVQVHRAENLRPVDASFKEQAKAGLSNLLHRHHHQDVKASFDNPYYKIRCGADLVQSDVKKNTLSPVFDSSIMFTIDEPSHQTVQMKFFTAHEFASAGFLGMVNISAGEMITWGEKSRTLYLLDDNGDQGERGTVVVSACWRPLLLHDSSEPLIEISPKTPRSFLFVGVYEGANLPSLGPEGYHWVTAQCTHVVQETHWKGQVDGRKMKENDAEDIQGQKEQDELRRKTHLLHSHGLSHEEIGDVLGTDTPAVKHLLSVDAHAHIGKRHTLKWSQPFGFVLHDPQKAVLTLRLMQRAKGEKKDHIADECNIEICQLLVADLLTKNWTQLLPQCGARLKLRLQLRDVGPISTKLVNY